MVKGDHIKVARWQGIYYHHGIDCGDGSVIHYSGEIASKQDAFIRRDTMESFLDGGILQICNDYEKLFSPNEIVQRAESRLGENAYGLYGNNCEHFARWCTTNKHLSEQVEAVKQTLTEIAIQGVAKGTQKVLVTFINSESSPLLNGIKSGQLQRYGSLLRSNATKGSGFYHILREGALPQAGSNLLDRFQQPLQQCLQMSSVAAAASVLNLGVSIAGFAYLAYQMNELKKCMGHLEQALEDGFQTIHHRFDSVEWRLEEIRLITTGNQVIAQEILEEVQALRDEFFDQHKGRLLAALEMAHLNPSTAIDNLRIFKEVRHGIQGNLLRGLKRQNLREMVGVAGRFRVWAIAAAAEGQSLLEMQHLREAESLFQEMGSHAFSCAALWLKNILDGRSWGMFGHSRFKDLIQEDRLYRIGLVAEGEALSTTDFLTYKSSGALIYDGFVKRLSDTDLQQYAGFAALVDLAIEVGQRFDSKHLECNLCRQQGWTMEQWLQLGRDTEVPLLLSFPIKTNNKWS